MIQNIITERLEFESESHVMQEFCKRWERLYKVNKHVKEYWDEVTMIVDPRQFVYWEAIFEKVAPARWVE